MGSKTTSDLKKKVITLKKQLDEKDQQIARLTQNSLSSTVLEKMERMEQHIAELKDKPLITNNLQIICVEQNDNYLDILTNK